MRRHVTFGYRSVMRTRPMPISSAHLRLPYGGPPRCRTQDAAANMTPKITEIRCVLTLRFAKFVLLRLRSDVSKDVEILVPGGLVTGDPDHGDPPEAVPAFVGSEPHRSTMARLDDWRDEATFADWQQSSPGLPDWQTSYRRLIAEGQVANLTHASGAHDTRACPTPAEAP